MIWPDPQRPRASAARIAAFLEQFGATQFRHASEFVPIMQRNDHDESFISYFESKLENGLRRVYRVRTKITAEAPPSPHYPPGLADDVRALSEQFAEASDQPLQGWHLLHPTGTTYSVWVLMDDKRIAGCVKSADQRIVNPSAW